MYNYNKELVKQLNTILPTSYELFIDTQTELPCITYLELSNVAEDEGDTLRYSAINYRIKLWAKPTENVNEEIYQIDDLMFSLGFKRRAYNELIDFEMAQYIFTYEGLALENI